MIPYKIQLVNKQTNLREIPARYTVKGYKVAGFSAVVIALFLGVKPLVFGLLSSLGLEKYSLSQTDWVFAVVALVFLVLGLSQFFVKGTIDLKDGKVVYNVKTIFGRKKWHAQFRDYKGLKQFRSTNYGSSSPYSTFHIKLVHKDPRKSLKIYDAWANDHIDEAMENYSLMFRLPLIK